MSLTTFFKDQRELGGPFWWLFVLWHLIWFLPAQLARVLLVTIMFFGWGHEAARDMWEATQ